VLAHPARLQIAASLIEDSLSRRTRRKFEGAEEITTEEVEVTESLSVNENCDRSASCGEISVTSSPYWRLRPSVRIRLWSAVRSVSSSRAAADTFQSV
jgi:hypothetical protein